MAKGGIYRCACNECWCDLYFTMTSSVPINVKSIENTMVVSFRNPGSLSGTTVVLVDVATFTLMAEKVTPTFIENTSFVYGNVLNNPDLLFLLQAMSEQYQAYGICFVPVAIRVSKVPRPFRQAGQ